MRKTLVFLLIGILIQGMVYAQDKSPHKKIGGVRLGFHSASMVVEGSKPDTVNNYKSFYVGFFRDNKIAPMLFFGTGLEYFQNGMKYPQNSTRVLHTISVPLDLKLKLGPVFALGGAAANIKVKEKYNTGDTSYSPSDTDKTKWFDVAAFAGAGVKIFFITVEARYHWGLLEARNDLYNRYFQLGAAISF